MPVIENNYQFDHVDEDKMNLIIIPDGNWESFIRKQKFLVKKKADEISYFWDGLINLAHKCSFADNKEHYENIARELARANRFERRIYSEKFFEAQSQAQKGAKNGLFHRVIKGRNTTFYFLFQDALEPAIEGHKKVRKLFISRLVKPLYEVPSLQ